MKRLCLGVIAAVLWGTCVVDAHGAYQLSIANAPSSSNLNGRVVGAGPSSDSSQRPVGVFSAQTNRTYVGLPSKMPGGKFWYRLLEAENPQKDTALSMLGDSPSGPLTLAEVDGAEDKSLEMWRWQGWGFDPVLYFGVETGGRFYAVPAGAAGDWNLVWSKTAPDKGLEVEIQTEMVDHH